MSKRKPTINYTSRDFTSIRRDLLSYVKKYYPTTYQDFSEASFGSLMIDTVSYVGDILSFYLDYQANESFLDTAIEYNNVIRLGRQLGHKFVRSHSSFGSVTCYVIVPALNEGLGPDTTFMPTLRKGSKFSTPRGSLFTLTDDVDFSADENDIVVATVNSDTGIPETYAIRAEGQVQSGEILISSVQVGEYEKFKKVRVPSSNITEVISVFDSDGNEYFEVDYLSQNVVYKETLNTNSDSSVVPNIIKPIVVARRYMVVNERNETFLQFGFGSEETVSENVVVDPSKVVLDRHGRTYNTDFSFDPSKLTETDKLGIAPSNTTLTITYRKNTDENVNASAGTINRVVDPTFRFANKTTLNAKKVTDVQNSLEVENQGPITGDVSLPSTVELKMRISDTYSAQNRAVTRQDYKAMVYSMPAKFGGVKRCNIVQDKDSFKRNLNMYIISTLPNGQLTTASDTLKQNLKVWINKNKMINDTVDILDAKIVNLGIDFAVTANINFDRAAVLSRCINTLTAFVSVKMDIGENLIISDITNELSKVDGVSSVNDVEISNIIKGGYSNRHYPVKRYLSADKKILYCPDNVVFEIKRPLRDIKGTIV